MTIAISYSRQRRDGFEILRDIVTRHRRAWSVNVDAYLRDRWDSELRAVANEFNRRTATRGRPPTFKQVATFAISAANHWFGGDLIRVYAALGETATGTTTRHDLLVGDPFVFANAVFADLGGRPLLPGNAPSEDTNKQWELRRLATESLRYLQLYEALGRPPTFEEFGAHLRWDHLGGPELGWNTFQTVIESARVQPLKPDPPQRVDVPELAAPSPPPAVHAAQTSQLPEGGADAGPAAPRRKGLFARLFSR